MFDIDLKKVAIFAGGVLFGSVGVKVLSSKDAKKVYTHCTAAALRAKDCAMETYDKVSENCNDILEDAKALNEKREEEEAKAEVANNEV
ncbi:MAG: DUF6110 family protein [Lachnospiraceae bacterium]|nr:DUF6110 family protein [Lachnospiraceae bacterium]